MGRDKNPSLQSACVVCRNKISVNLNIKCSNEREDTTEENNGNLSSWRLKAIFMESFCMAFGLPSNHPFLTLFINKKCARGRLCLRCFEDVSKIHHIFWQFQSLEKKLIDLQVQFFQRLRSNYEAIPTLTLFSSLGVPDLVTNLERLKYDEVVKIMFEKIKDIKDEWPKPHYLSRWKEAADNAEKLGEEMKNIHPVSLVEPKAKPEVNSKIEVNKLDTPAHPVEDDHDYVNVSASRPKRAASANVELLQRAEAENQNEEDWATMTDDFDDDDEKNMIRRSVRSREMSNTVSKKKVRGKRTPEGDVKVMRFLCIEDPEICSRTYKSRKHLKTHIRVFHNGKTEF